MAYIVVLLNLKNCRWAWTFHMEIPYIYSVCRQKFIDMRRTVFFSHAQTHRLVMKSRPSSGKQTLLCTKYPVLNVYYACRGFPLWEQRAGEGVTLQAVCGRPDNSITDTFSALHCITLYYFSSLWPNFILWLICPYIWLFVHPSWHSFLCLPVLHSFWFIHHSFVCPFWLNGQRHTLPVCQGSCHSASCLSVHLSIRPSIHPSIHPLGWWTSCGLRMPAVSEGRSCLSASILSPENTHSHTHTHISGPSLSSTPSTFPSCLAWLYYDRWSVDRHQHQLRRAAAEGCCLFARVKKMLKCMFRSWICIYIFI